MRKSRRSATPVVYFVRCEVTGLVKIGTSWCWEKRLRSLRAGSPTPLTVERVIDGGIETERAAHRQFSEHRRHGEWFALTTEQVLAAETSRSDRKAFLPPETKAAISRIVRRKMDAHKAKMAARLLDAAEPGARKR